MLHTQLGSTLLSSGQLIWGAWNHFIIHNHNESWGSKPVFISFVFCLPESGLKTFFPEAVSDGLTLHIPERSLVLHWLLGASEPLDFPA